MSGDSVRTNYSGYSLYPTTFQGTSEARKTERENQTHEAGSFSFQGISRSEACNYQNYFNTTLSYVDQLRYPGNLPDLNKTAKKEERGSGGDHGISTEHGTGRDDGVFTEHGTGRDDGISAEHGTGRDDGISTEHGTGRDDGISTEHGTGSHEGSSAHGNSKTHGEGHGSDGQSHFIEGTHTSEGIHKSVEEIARIARTERTAASVTRTLETSAAGMAEASTISNVLTETTEAALLPEAGALTTTGTSSLSGPASTATGTGSSTLRSPSLETPRVPLKEPISWDMQQYVDAVRESRVAETAPRLPTANASCVTAETSTTSAASATKPATALAKEGTEAGNALHGAGHHGGSFHKVMGTAEKVLAPAAVLAGGFEVAHGIHQIHQGETVVGSLNVAGGAAGVTAGTAATVNAFGMASSAATTAALGTVAGVGFGAVAAIDGVKTIYEGIKEKDTEKTVVGGVKTAAGGAMIAGVCTGNPVLVVGGAVTYAGAVVYENREAIADGAKKAYNWTADKVGKGVQATEKFAGNVAHSVAAKAQSIKQETGKLIDSGVKKAGEIKDAAVQTVTEVAHKAAEVKQAVTSTISNTASAAAGTAQGAWKWATSWL